MRPVVYDAGALVAAERGSRGMWADHRVRLEAGSVPVVAAPVLAQVSRSPRQVQLRRLLRGCDVVALDEEMANAAGRLLGFAGSSDVVDAVVAHVAQSRGADLVTSNRSDIGRLLDAAGAVTGIVDI